MARGVYERKPFMRRRGVSLEIKRAIIRAIANDGLNSKELARIFDVSAESINRFRREERERRNALQPSNI